jgi:LysM repeat protein
MSSIRPLITITILVAVGAFMFMKINEGPVALPPEMDESLGQTPAVEIPPLTTATDVAAPAWNDPPKSVAAIPSAPPVNLPSEVPASVPEKSSVTTAPADVPPIPELPPIAAAPAAAPATTPAELAPIQLPANIPVAQYPGDATTANATAEPVTPITPESASPPVASAYQPPAAAPAAEVTPPEMSPAGDNRYGALSADASAATTTQTPAPAAAPAPTAEPVTPIAPSTPTFASEWPQIQGALDRQELVAAHEMLSRWYGNPNLTPAEAQQVEVLLSQLAGTVVYSTEHRLEPPYTVHSGDTLQTIAQQYDVPWQLLAKINGIPAANMVQPGQQLKVIHGPFSAVVELDKNQMTLMLNGRYAGRFPITVPSGATVSEGQWVLEQKLVQPATQESGVVSASYTPTGVDHVLVLRNESPTAGGATISITAGPGVPSGPTAVAPSAIRLSPHDVEEVADILSVGSPVTIRR